MNEQSNNTNKNKGFKKFVEVIKTDKQKRAWLILFGYFIFFLILVLMIRSNASTSNYNNTNNSNLKNINISDIKRGNYHFKYTINLDRNVISYEGETSNNKALFYKNINGVTENYYEENDTYYIKINNIWTTSTNPYILSSLMDIEIVEKILEESKYVSKTEYEDSTKQYNYQVSTTTLVKILDSEIADLDDIPNDIIITTDSSNNIKKIEFNLSSYTNYKLLSTTSSNLVIEYSKINEIESINIELN